MTRKQLETSTHAHCCLLQVCEWYVEPNLIYVLLVMRLSSMNTSLDIISTNKWGGNLRNKMMWRKIQGLHPFSKYLSHVFSSPM